MNSVAIVTNLHQYLSLLHEIESREQRDKANDTNFYKSVSLRYNTITARLSYKSQKETFYSDYIGVAFTIEEQNITLKDITCENNERVGIINDYVLQHAPTTFPSSSDVNILSKASAQYLNIADEIAKHGYMCARGDDYRPGYFSEIKLDENEIILSQINHWNARSIDHKNDYHLRNLEFKIPYAMTESRLGYGAEKIGRMIVEFSDRSSKNNKGCGDNIFNEIQEQKSKFKNEMS